MDKKHLYESIITEVAKIVKRHINEEFYDDVEHEDLTQDIEIDFDASTELCITLFCEPYMEQEEAKDIDGQFFPAFYDTLVEYESEDFAFIKPIRKKIFYGDSTGAPLSTIKYTTTISSALETEDAVNLIMNIISIAGNIDNDMFKQNINIDIYQSKGLKNKVHKYNASLDIYLDNEPDYSSESDFIDLIKALTGDKFDMDTVEEMV